VAGSFAGDSDRSGFSGGDRGYDDFRSGRGRKKMASLNKKKMDKKGSLKKRTAFRRDKSRDAIFKNMSQFIQSYCFNKCY